MDTFDIKLEKRNAILKHRHLYNIANWLRFVEFCVVLVLISRFTTQLPVAVKNSGEYVRGLSVVLVSPRFVFIVGNVIVITLFAKAGQFSAQDSTAKSSGTDLYQEFVEKSEKSQAIHRYGIEYREKQSKKSVVEEKIVCLNVHTSKGTKHYKRSQSENLKRVNCNEACQQLRRLESEKYRKHNDSDQTMVKSSYPEDGMSSDQFRDAVEAFIARQKKLLREEEYTVIWQDLE
ncbi:uncharacterized protein LOC110418465 [Herrania umbratica]|uniref:Uncharacterized protein LOC110418465 n=1 Tax=Herrania umbratica TaxID=108875 RepID=A0A6J1AJW8_9ROSI|nr:uncharacterized protein LOC110418465 [Herrania umbratica]